MTEAQVVVELGEKQGKKPVDGVARMLAAQAKQDAVFDALCVRWQCRPAALAKLRAAVLAKRVSEHTGQPANPEQTMRAAEGYAKRAAK